MKRYYTFDSEFKKTEFDNLQYALKSDLWNFILVQDGTPYDDQGNFTIESIRFVNMGESSISNKLTFKGWAATLEELSCTQYNFYMKFRFKEPGGRIRYFKQYKDIYGIISVMKMLVELGPLSNWEQYDILEQDKSLKNQIELLKKKVTEYELEINELKKNTEDTNKN